MKKLFYTGSNELYLNLLILFLRIATAAMMLTHGWPKLLKLLEGGEIQFGDPLGLGPAFTLVLAVGAEVFCSIFIALGLATRLASIPLIITMFVAAFISHGPDPFRQKEMALLYLLFYVSFLIVGSRKYSIDYLISRKSPD